MKWIKAILVGMTGSLIMFILMMIGIHGTGVAPFNVPPSAAFLIQLGMAVGPLPLVLHFGYGAFWSVLLLVLFNDKIDIKKGLGLAMVAWLIMMVIYSPIIGWGFFGFGHAHMLAPNNPLYLQAGPKYLIATLILHIIFGLIIGWLNPKWIHFAPRD